MSELTHHQDISAYYESTNLSYDLIWQRLRNWAMHYGFYDDQHRTHNRAVIHMNERIAETVGITEEDHVLDAGCGVGGSAIWLAQNRGCEVTGINVLPGQLKRINKRAHRRSVGHNIHLVSADFEQMSFPEETFDVVWALESVVHALDKRQFVDEAHRVLKPAGRLVISETMKTGESFTPEQTTDFDIWLKNWAMPHLYTPKQYESAMAAAGFEGIEVRDWTPHIAPSMDRLGRYNRFFRPMPPKIKKYVMLMDQRAAGNMDAVDSMLRLLGQGAWQYTVITAAKAT